MTSRRPLLIQFLLAFGFLLAPWSGASAAGEGHPSIHHVDAKACKQCHEEIYHQWRGSMHAKSSALEDPLHGAFYQKVMGSPTEEGLRKKGKFPVCLKCHAPIAAFEGKTDLSAKPAYAQGIGCTTCHSFKAFKGVDKPDGKPAYGIDAYEMDTQALYGPSGITYTTDRVPEDAMWPMPVHHPQPMVGNKGELFQSNDACMGCHEKRSNFHGTPLCRTGHEYRKDNNFVACQACHMPVVSVPKMKDGDVVPGEFVSIADHSMGGGHDPRMVKRGLALQMEAVPERDVIDTTITLRNRLPHSLPTGAPFRNMYLKLAAYDAEGNELWKNYQRHPIMDDPQAAFWYTLGNEAGEPTAPPMATQVLSDTRLKPNETRTLFYQIPRTPEVAIVRAEVLYDLVLPPIKQMVKGKVPDDWLRPKLAGAAEYRL